MRTRAPCCANAICGAAKTASRLKSEQEMFWRVAYHVAKAEEEFGGDVDGVARRFYDLLTNLRFFPNSPTFTGAGTPLGQLAACFVLQIDDDMGRTGSGIFETLRDAALIQQTGGGNGFSFSRLRPKGAIVRSSNGSATGPVGFLRVYDRRLGRSPKEGHAGGQYGCAACGSPGHPRVHHLQDGRKRDHQLQHQRGDHRRLYARGGERHRF